MKTDGRPDVLHCVCFETPPAWSVAVGQMMEALEWSATSWTPENGGPVRFELFLPSAHEAGEAATRLRELLPQWTDGREHEVRQKVVPAEDWQESWKRFFHVERVSERIVIKPTWESYAATGGEIVIDIDPGMSFGTGQHGTTRACLQFIDRYVAGGGSGSFLDLGCGSGILSIAAARLGLAPVLAMDHDAVALENARENLARNEVEESVEVEHADLTVWQPPRRYPLVAANILATVLASCHTTIASAVSEEGNLLLAGILTERYAEIRELSEREGFTQLEQVTIDEWTSGWFRKGDSRV